MGCLSRPHSLEADQLKITAKQLPCTKALVANIERRYSHNSATSLGVVSDNRELLLNLEHKKFFLIEPAAAVVTLDDSSGKWPAMSARQGTLLKWLLQSLAYWEVSYPLDDELRDQFRALMPHLARRALDDQSFTMPGAHPLHRILDTLQSQAVGWQPGQGRAGDTLQRSLHQALDSTRRALEQRDDQDLVHLADQLEQAALTEERRAARMVQRLIEKVQGQHKTSAARNIAAQRINAALGRQSLPAPVGRFIKGPWYDSAQLVLLKFGEQSEQWQHMSETTDRLVDSMQPRDVNETDEQSRQELFERLKGLPADLRRWLLSLQHDQDSVSDAIGLIEFAHLRLLRQQALQLYPVEPLPVAGGDSTNPVVPASIAQLEPGQWFLIRGDGPRSSQRAQLTAKLDPQQQLLFNNRAGMKAFSITYNEFDRALSQKTARVLQREGSFSLSLLRAAGITNVEQLDKLQPVSAPDHNAPRTSPASHSDDSQLAGKQGAPPESTTSSDSKAFLSKRAIQTDHPPAVPGTDVEEIEVSLRNAPDHDGPEVTHLTADELHAPPGMDPDPDLLMSETADADAPEVDMGEIELPGALDLVPAVTEGSPDQSDADPEPLGLATGTWLGFHDCDPPMLARLAAHDREQGQYIFVNRRGVKLRQLSTTGLLALAEQDLVDIFESRGNFRDHVNRLKSNPLG